MSTPISAMTTSAVRWPTPGMVISRRTWSAKGATTRSTSASRAVDLAVEMVDVGQVQP